MTASTKKFLLAFLGFALVLVVDSCRHESDIPASPAVSFSHDIQPILSGNCNIAGCHDGTGEESESLLNYADVMEHGEVTAGDAHASKLYQVVLKSGAERMPPPPSERLSDRQFKLIYVWIEQGAKNN